MALPNNRHIRMPSGGGGGGPFGGGGGPVEYVATSNAMSRVTSAPNIITSNTNSNDLSQDNYAAAGHRLGEPHQILSPTV